MSRDQHTEQSVRDECEWAALPHQNPEKRLHAAQAVVDTAQRAYAAQRSIETAMLLDAARRKLYLAKRECRSVSPKQQKGTRYVVHQRMPGMRVQ